MLFRSPLTSMMGYLELLSDEDRQMTEMERKRYTEIAYQKSIRLNDLVQELFMYTSLTSPDVVLKKERVNLSVLVGQLVESYVLDFLEEGLTLNFYHEEKADVYAAVDIKRMNRAFENLLKNAQKYSDPHTEVSVRMQITEGCVILEFKNVCHAFKIGRAHV